MGTEPAEPAADLGDTARETHHRSGDQTNGTSTSDTTSLAKVGSKRRRSPAGPNARVPDGNHRVETRVRTGTPLAHRRHAAKNRRAGPQPTGFRQLATCHVL